LLGMPQWEPGQDDRTIPQHKVRSHDRAAIEREAGERRPMTEDERANIQRATDIWNEAKDPRGTLAERYLREQRKLDLPQDLAGSVLRFHPRCPWRDESLGQTIRVPAVIAVFRSIYDNAIQGIHRIALNPDGTKIDRKMLGPSRGAAVKLTAGENPELVVGEGIETCMAARQLGITGSIWALGSAGSITFLPVLPGVHLLTLLAETGEASAKAIRICGARWKRAGRQVRVARSLVGSDFNDALMAGAQ
jgi:putative DNA primase/helicase